MSKPITPTNMHRLMESILRVLYQSNAACMVNFYVNNKHFSTDEHDGYIRHDLRKDRIYWEDPIPNDVTKQIEYNNPETITMTFEGPLYHNINYGNGNLLEKIDKLASTYGLYAELGYAWSLALYE